MTRLCGNAYARALLAATALLFGGCATTGDLIGFSSHPQRAAEYRNAIRSGQPAVIESAAASIGARATGRDSMLYLMERGRLYSVAGDYEAAIADFQSASDAFERERMSPTLSVSAGFFSAGALATNDLALPYRAPGFERVMLHNLQALNYLLAGDTSSARIELNRADVEQSYALEQNAKLVREAEQLAASRGIEQAVANQRYGPAPVPTSAAGSIKNSFQNAFTFYLSGVLFEHLGDTNRALIEYRRALEIFPRNRTFERAAARVAGPVAPGPADPAGAGRVVVIFENGFVTPRDSIRVPFIWDDTLQQVVIPFHPGRNTPPYPLDILDSGGRTLGTTELACDLDLMAARALSEMMPAIFVRQALRVLAKHEMARIARREGGDWGLIGTTIFNVVTDKADERAWLTLPANVQIAEFMLPPGAHSLSLEHGGAGSGPIEIEVTSHGTTFIVARAFENRIGAVWARAE